MVSSATMSMGGPASANIGKKTEKEAIHSGHFMVSDFEAEAQDDEENVLLEIPDEGISVNAGGSTSQDLVPVAAGAGASGSGVRRKYDGFDTSLTKLFNAMSIAYKHKITSPKWNRFKGLKLRWKDKIRLNNVIWRCWHMQFVRRKKMTVCQFALEVDNNTTHNKQETCGLPQAVVLEGKYWKRQLDAVTAEYKKWRIYYKNKATGKDMLIPSDEGYLDASDMDWMRTLGGPNSYSLEDGDISELMDFNDVLFSSLFSQPQGFVFPNPREIARGTDNSTFMQPGLIQLQPNLDDFMDIVEPLQEMLAGHRGGLPILPTVPEEDLFPDVPTPEPASQMSPLPAPPAPSSQTPTTPTLNNSMHFTARVTTQPYSNHHHQAPASPPNHSSSPTSPIVNHSSPLSNHSSPSHKPLLATIDHHSLYTSTPIQSSQSHQTPTLQQHHSPSNLGNSPSPPGSYRSSPVLRPPTLQTPDFDHGNSLGSSGGGAQMSPPRGSRGPPPRQEGGGGRVFLRASHSQPDLLKVAIPASAPSPLSPQQPGQPGFIIPKQVPRRRSHSSGTSSSNNSSNRVSQHTQQQHHVITSLPQLAPAPPPHHHTTHLPIQVMPTPVVSHHLMPTPVMSTPIMSTPAVPSGSSQLLEHLLTTNNYTSLSSHNSNAVISNSSSSSSSSSSSQQLKVSLVIPGVIPSPTSTNTLSNSSSSVVYSNHNIPVSSSAATFMPPVTLSPVTPSTLKNNNHFNQLAAVWSTGVVGSPRSIKTSPPHGGEPSSPLNMLNVPSPQSKPFRPKNDHERVQYKEHRRVCHINAEQKRRSNLKNNFDIMHQLIPSISQNPNAKVSKAAMLHKGAEYIHQLKTERQNLSEQTEKLKQQIETLSSEISNAQALLPATGAPMTHARHSKLKEMFNQYTRERTMANWKFYIFGLITEPLVESYNSSVSTGNLDDLCRSSLAWLDQQCSLNVLRPLVSNSMRKLSTTTNVLADPESLPEEVFQRITKQEHGQDRFTGPR